LFNLLLMVWLLISGNKPTADCLSLSLFL